MTDSQTTRDWSDVDGEDSAEAFTEYLETVTGAEAVQAYKRRSHGLLHPDPGDRILDVGCGTGQDALMLSEAVGPDGEVVGVDNSETMVEAARENAGDVPTVRFALDDALDLSFPDDTFDAARADRVLQHLDDPLRAVVELCRVTKPGGRVAVTDPDWETIILEAPGGQSEAFLSLDHANTHNPRVGRRLYRYAKEAGLADVEVDPWTAVSTELAFIEQAGTFETWLDAMEAAGAATRSEIEEWYAGLEAADEGGLLFGSLTGFTVAGTVPP